MKLSMPGQEIILGEQKGISITPPSGDFSTVWNQYSSDHKRTGYINQDTPVVLSQAGIIDFEISDIGFAPIISNGDYVYVSDTDSSTIEAFDPVAAVREWSTTIEDSGLPGATNSPLVIGLGDNLIAASEEIYALDPVTGSIETSESFADITVDTSLNFAELDGVLYGFFDDLTAPGGSFFSTISTVDATINTLYKLRDENGDIINTSDVNEFCITSDGVLYVSFEFDNKILRIEIDGTVTDMTDFEGFNLHLSHDEELVFTNADGNLIAVEASDLSIRWSEDTGGLIAIGEDSVYSGGDGEVVSRSISDGSLEWTQDFSGRYGTISTPLILSDSTLYFYDNSSFAMLNPENGDIISEFDIDVASAIPPAITSDALAVSQGELSNLILFTEV